MRFHMPAESQQAFLDGLKYDARGLVSVIIQDADSGEVLMLRHSTRAALATARLHGPWGLHVRPRHTARRFWEGRE